MHSRMGFAFLSLTTILWCAPASRGAPTAKPAEDEAKTVYFNDFEKGQPGEEWSKSITDATPTGKRHFLGQFGQEAVTLTLLNLPKHKLLRVSFDLYIINAWDGNHPEWGPDIFEIGIVGRPLFLHTSFSNCGFFSDNNEQSFPDSFPSKAHPGFSGCAEKQTLGYIRSWGGKDRTFVCDSVYHFVFAFPHQDNKMEMKWNGRASEPKKDESWGLDNVRVETLAEPVSLHEVELSTLWDDLALDGNEAIRAFHATWKLVSAADQSAAFLKTKYVRTDYDPQLVATLIAQLDADTFKTRQRAARELAALGPKIVAPLKTALAAAPSEEARSHLESLLAAATKPDSLRRARVARALDAINTPDAVELRKVVGEAPFPAE